MSDAPEDQPATELTSKPYLAGKDILERQLGLCKFDIEGVLIVNVKSPT